MNELMKFSASISKTDVTWHKMKRISWITSYKVRVRLSYKHNAVKPFGKVAGEGWISRYLHLFSALDQCQEQDLSFSSLARGSWLQILISCLRFWVGSACLSGCELSLFLSPHIFHTSFLWFPLKVLLYSTLCLYSNTIQRISRT